MRVFSLIGLLIAFTAAPALGDVWTWDQMQALDSYAGASWIDTDTPSDATSADDFLCNVHGNINQIQFAGWSYYGEAYLQSFRITFYADVPASSSDQSHPGDILWQQDNLPFTYIQGSTTPYTYQVDLPGGFYQTGTPEQPTVYWVSVEGRMVADGFFDAWYWNFRSRTIPAWNDDAAFKSSYFGYAPWANWGVDSAGTVGLYDGLLPAGWTSLDMAFKLIGDKVPEPATLGLLALGLVLVRRR